MPRKTNTDHIVIDMRLGNALRCLNCGDIYKPQLPIAITDFVALSDSFAKRHRRCKPQAGVPAGGREEETFQGTQL